MSWTRLLEQKIDLACFLSEQSADRPLGLGVKQSQTELLQSERTWSMWNLDLKIFKAAFCFSAHSTPNSTKQTKQKAASCPDLQLPFSFLNVIYLPRFQFYRMGRHQCGRIRVWRRRLQFSFLVFVFFYQLISHWTRTTESTRSSAASVFLRHFTLIYTSIGWKQSKVAHCSSSLHVSVT